MSPRTERRSTFFSGGVDLVPAKAGTKVSWQGDAELSHGLAAFAAGMLEPMAKKNVMKLIDGLQAALK